MLMLMSHSSRGYTISLLETHGGEGNARGCARDAKWRRTLLSAAVYDPIKSVVTSRSSKVFYVVCNKPTVL